MAIVEIWKAKPSWFTLPLSIRKKIVERLTDVIASPHFSGNGSQDAGPFLIQKEGICLLVWISHTDETAGAARYAESGLTEYCEPLVYATATNVLAAKVLAEKLSG